MTVFFQENDKRTVFLQKVNKLMQTVIQKYLPVDAACDQMGKQFIHDSLPPCVTEGTILLFSIVYLC